MNSIKDQLEENTLTKDLKVESEFAGLINPLSEGEHEELSSELKKNGCIDPIVTWRGIIVDGHNRYKICKENDIPFTSKEIDLPNREAVKEWIITNQLARRNLSLYAKYEFLEKRGDIKEKRETAKKNRLANLRGHGITDLPSFGNSTENINIQSELAKELGVSKGTISKMQLISKWSRKEKVSPEIIAALRRGDTTVTKVYLQIKKTGTEGKSNKKTEGNRSLEHCQAIITGIEGLKLADLLNLDSNVRNELVKKIWQARKNLTKIGQGLSYAKKYPDLVSRLAVGKINVDEFQKLIQGTVKNRQSVLDVEEVRKKHEDQI
jgi:DNA-binding XRE family transcriptional regulator